MRSESSQNLSQGNRKETKFTPRKCRCMSETVDPGEERFIKILETPNYYGEEVLCLSLADT